VPVIAPDAVKDWPFTVEEVILAPALASVAIESASAANSARTAAHAFGESLIAW